MEKNNKKETRYTGENGTGIKIALSAIGSKVIPKRKGTDINGLKTGKLSSSDWRNIEIGISALNRILSGVISKLEMEILSGKTDVSPLKKEVYGYRKIIEDLVKRIGIETENESEIAKRKEFLLKSPQIIDAARDGILLKTEERKENVDGKEEIVKYDTSMTPREVEETLDRYERELARLQFNRLNCYMGLGLNIAGVVGTIIKDVKSRDTNKGIIGSSTLLTAGTIVASGVQLIQGVMDSKKREEQWKLRNKSYQMTYDIMRHEAVSNTARTDEIKNTFEVIDKERKTGRKVDNQEFAVDIIRDLTIAILQGITLSKSITRKENGKIDGKSIALSLIDLQNSTGVARGLVNATEGVVRTKQDEKDFKRLLESYSDIIRQMEEKVYPLQGANHSFDSVSIKDFKGKFYPKKDYETGEINFSRELIIPEFSIKRGDTVLLSGESGAGKSTFLRLLKRGDINNRYPIELDGEEKVDNLGNEYISFSPSLNLGDESNVLYQITGKQSISELTKEETSKVLDIFKELKFDTTNLLEQLASKKFMEFSTGQQRRLALSKMFYRIDDATSVIIVDEPVGNVEDSLIREQLEMIKEYAQNKNVMLILTTHRLDLAEDLATKRYHINKNGIMEEIPIKEKQEKPSDEVADGLR